MLIESSPGISLAYIASPLMGWLREITWAAGIVKPFFIISVTNIIPRNDVLPQKQVGYKQSS